MALLMLSLIDFIKRSAKQRRPPQVSFVSKSPVEPAEEQNMLPVNSTEEIIALSVDPAKELITPVNPAEEQKVSPVKQAEEMFASFVDPAEEQNISAAGPAEDQIAELPGMHDPGRASLRFVYHLWNRQRNQLKGLQSESDMLEDQIKQLQIKATFYRTQCEEDRKRILEAKTLARQKQLEIQEMVAKLDFQVEEKLTNQQIIEVLDQRINDLEDAMEQANNESIAARSACSLFEEQIGREKEHYAKLVIEQKTLYQKASDLENASRRQEMLYKRHLAVSKQLDQELQIRTSNNKLLQKYIDETNERIKLVDERTRSLEKKHKFFRLEENRIIQECSWVEQQISLAKKKNMELKISNSELKARLQKVQLQKGMQMEKPTHRSWKRKAMDAMRVPMNVLKEMALILLPALPGDVFTRRCTCQDCSDR